MTSARAFRFHPVTRQDANDFSGAPLSDEQRVELAAMFRAGARFYWLKLDDGALDAHGFGRVERANYSFVASAVGAPVEWVDA